MRIVDNRKKAPVKYETGAMSMGDTMIVTEGGCVGVVILRAYSSWVNLNNPSQTWSPNPRLYGYKVDAIVTITEPVPF